MHLPNPYLTRSHLKTLITPEQYLAFIQRYVYTWGPSFDLGSAGDDFWQSLPEYRLAQCPFCGQEYSEALNTYGLHGWLFGGHESVYMDKKAWQRRCPHFAAVGTHLNFNNCVPDEIKRVHVKIDVPCVTPAYLDYEPPTVVVVMHSLPICRIERGQFVPRYLLYTLVYYSDQGYLDLGRQIESHADTGVDDGEFFPAYFDSGGDGIEVEHWAKREKVLWLDPSTLELRRWQGGQHKFPYAKIHGYKVAVEFYKGKIEFPYS